MTKIIPIRYSDIRKVRKLIEYVSPEISPGTIEGGNLLNFPLSTIHRALPVNLKFLQECYVAIEDNEPLGLISLAPDGSVKDRWKINRFILGMNAQEIGKQLIDYVVNKYGGAGVEIFVTIIDENYTEAIALFKHSCTFRDCSKINIWKYEDTEGIKSSEKNHLFRKAQYADAAKLFELDSEAIFPHFRPTLGKNIEDLKFGLKNKIVNNLKGFNSFKYVLDNPAKERIEGLISITTTDNKHFWADMTISKAYDLYVEDMIRFTINKVKEINPQGIIYFGVKEYHQAAKSLTEPLSHYNFSLCGNYQVLVKDYWKPVTFSTEKKVPGIIFPDMTSPACNIVRFISDS